VTGKREDHLLAVWISALQLSASEVHLHLLLDHSVLVDQELVALSVHEQRVHRNSLLVSHGACESPHSQHSDLSTSEAFNHVHWRDSRHAAAILAQPIPATLNWAQLSRRTSCV